MTKKKKAATKKVAKKKRKVVRSSKDGKFVKKEEAVLHPGTTQTETID